MAIVVDANIIISALLGSRRTIKLLTCERYHFYTPRWVIEEIRKYQRVVCEKVECSMEEFEANWDALTQFITIINFEEYSAFLGDAHKAIDSRDIKDADYLACALSLCAEFIWTNDKDFLAQQLVPVKSTDQFLVEHQAAPKHS